MYIDERSDQFWVATNPGGNATNNTFPARTPLAAPGPIIQPVNGVQAAQDGLIPLGHGGGETSRRVLLVPFGVGASGTTFMMNIYGWKTTSGNLWGTSGGESNRLWIPVLLSTYSIILGTQTGIIARDINAGQNFAGTITQTFSPTVTAGGVLPDDFTSSPGSSAIGIISQLTMGMRYLEATFQMGTATSGNCLWTRW